MKSATGIDGVVVLDFETTGMSPDKGDRAIEIGAVRIINGHIVERFESLMNPDRPFSPFIEQLTGISNAMVREAPSAGEVMERFYGFIGDSPLVAHNASFDRRFLDAELALLGRKCSQPMACSMLAARRLYPDAPTHRLQTLVDHYGLPKTGTWHRALADAEMTAHLWLKMEYDIEAVYGIKQVPFALLHSLAEVPKRQAAAFLQRQAAEIL